MIFDTHAHYDDERFNEDREELLANLKNENVAAVVNVGATFKGCASSMVLAGRWDFIYAAVGIHPDDAPFMDEDTIAKLRMWLSEPKCVAVGEIGLDYSREDADRECQKFWFKRQLTLAKEENKPVIIHSRDAAEDTLAILKDYHRELKEAGEERSGLFKNPGVIHCFSYGTEIAREYVKMGFFIGVGGVSTFKNGRKLKEVIADTPLENIILETDCPYLAPVPVRGSRNYSGNIRYVVDAISEIKGAKAEEIENITFENAKKMYRLNQ
ncbi:MAG: TatD family hydrolase [Lachnospiraceae bacterium]|nr:TatD family hydrolase [Lachnospiraceae bacterium]